MKGNFDKRLVITGVCLAVLSGTACAAPSLQEPGKDVKEVIPEQAATVENTETAVQQTHSAESFRLKDIHMDAGEVRLDEAVMQGFFRESMNRDITLGELNTAVAQLTQYCRSHGYPAAAAYIPEQKMADGILTIRILPGRYGSIRIDNQSRLHPEIAEGLSHGLQSGKIIEGRTLETALYNISNLGGIQAVGILSPGVDTGCSDLTIRVRDGKQNTTILYSENYGSTASGRYRYGLQSSWNNLSGTGDRLSVNGLLSNHDLKNYAISYELPMGHSGTKIGFGISRMNYELGDVFRALGAQGKADTVNLYGITPLYRQSNRSLLFTYGYDYRSLTDDLSVLSGKKHSHALHVGLNGQQSEGRGLLQYTADLYTGTLGMDSDYTELLNQYNHTSGRYTKLVVSGTYVQTFNQDWDMLVKVSGQKASKNLDSSEEIYLGGPNAVRAYPQGEGSGDEGYVGTMELRYHTRVPGLSISTYLDGGHVNIAKDGSSGGETLKGWGIGVTYSRPNDWFARFDYARRIGLGDNAGNEAKSNGRMWFLIGKIW